MAGDKEGGAGGGGGVGLPYYLLSIICLQLHNSLNRENGGKISIQSLLNINRNLRMFKGPILILM